MAKRIGRADRELGLGRRISRRQFLDGVAIGTAALAAGAPLSVDAGSAPPAPQGEVSAARTASGAGLDPYPPARTGMRGSHDGAFETAHALRDGNPWRSFGKAEDTGETYDLVVVGAGISGLSAAHFFRRATGGRVLLLDNHDDFGGHARRNELTHDGKTYISYGGSWAVDSPAPYSATAQALIHELGVKVSRWDSVRDARRYEKLGLGRGIFFDRETFGVDRLLADPTSPGPRARRTAWRDFLKHAPLPDAARRDYQVLCGRPRDPWPTLDSAAKKHRLARMSYAHFLTDVLRADPAVIKLMQARTHSLYGVGIDAVPAQDAWGLGLPGFDAMKLDPGAGPGMNRDAQPSDGGPYFFHFPDGNASLTRLLVRSLIPAAIPGSTMDDVVGAHVAYALLDDARHDVRIRLRSTVVHVRHAGDPSRARQVELSYVQDGRLRQVRAARCVLACWNGVIPYICPELPKGQRDALAYGAKVPLLYTNVLVRDWQAFAKLGLQSVQAPGSYHTQLSLASALSIGNYASPRDPSEPMVLHLMRTPCFPGVPARDQHRAGRAELLGTTFADMERKIRDQLARTLSPGGFDPARDILGITVNRWAHGYAYQYNSLWDPFWLEGGETPCEKGRRPYGRIAIANADAGAYAYADGAIDQAHRAVRELLG